MMARKKNKDKGVGLSWLSEVINLPVRNVSKPIGRCSGIELPSIRSIKDFDSDVLAFSGGYMLVYFYADWCEYCKKMAKVFNKLSSDFQDITFLKIDLHEITFMKINIDDNQEVAEKYCEEGIPNLFLFKNGTVHANFLGYDKIKAVKAWLSAALLG